MEAPNALVLTSHGIRQVVTSERIVELSRFKEIPTFKDVLSTVTTGPIFAIHSVATSDGGYFIYLVFSRSPSAHEFILINQGQILLVGEQHVRVKAAGQRFMIEPELETKIENHVLSRTISLIKKNSTSEDTHPMFPEVASKKVPLLDTTETNNLIPGWITAAEKQYAFFFNVTPNPTVTVQIFPLATDVPSECGLGVELTSVLEAAKAFEVFMASRKDCVVAFIPDRHLSDSV